MSFSLLRTLGVVHTQSVSSPNENEGRGEIASQTCSTRIRQNLPSSTALSVDHEMNPRKKPDCPTLGAIPRAVKRVVVPRRRSQPACVSPPCRLGPRERDHASLYDYYSYFTAVSMLLETVGMPSMMPAPLLFRPSLAQPGDARARARSLSDDFFRGDPVLRDQWRKVAQYMTPTLGRFDFVSLFFVFHPWLRLQSLRK
ncbi:hypothetical protein VTO42DRAFT_4155 [Malbranchea cinnamomea]